KIASDWRKPDGLFVIRPQQARAFLAPLPVGRVHGVGKVTERKLAALGIATVGDLRAFGRDALEQRFGAWGVRLHELSCGVDERPVVANQPLQSVSSEDTFASDLRLDELEPAIRALAARTWAAARRRERVARTVVLKLKTSDF